MTDDKPMSAEEFAELIDNSALDKSTDTLGIINRRDAAIRAEAVAGERERVSNILMDVANEHDKAGRPTRDASHALIRDCLRDCAVAIRDPAQGGE